MYKPITYALLVERKACKLQLDLFKKHFGKIKAIPLTKEVVTKFGSLFDTTWAADHLMTKADYVEYIKVTATAYAEYIKVTATAYAEYTKVKVPAYAEYTKVKVPAWEEYQRAIAPAYVEYRKVIATKFVEIYKRGLI